ncbi:hypothetical protein COB55_03405 [Candidatus Wolfebacteria bacterium]|nr:MAG: hypothetical protein COB55_03405 [Candidatus Wolfebacteria bacterium]
MTKVIKISESELTQLIKESLLKEEYSIFNDPKAEALLEYLDIRRGMEYGLQHIEFLGSPKSGISNYRIINKSGKGYVVMENNIDISYYDIFSRQVLGHDVRSGKLYSSEDYDVYRGYYQI